MHKGIARLLYLISKKPKKCRLPIKLNTYVVAVVSAFLLGNMSSTMVLAHGGGLDQSGGHNCYVGSCAGTYHYHRGSGGDNNPLIWLVILGLGGWYVFWRYTNQNSSKSSFTRSTTKFDREPDYYSKSKSPVYSKNKYQRTNDASKSYTNARNLSKNSRVNRSLDRKLVTPVCPVCSSDMRKRNGRYGRFWGCSKYPKCRGTRNL